MYLYLYLYVYLYIIIIIISIIVMIAIPAAPVQVRAALRQVQGDPVEALVHLLGSTIKLLLIIMILLQGIV